MQQNTDFTALPAMITVRSDSVRLNTFAQHNGFCGIPQESIMMKANRSQSAGCERFCFSQISVTKGVSRMMTMQTGQTYRSITESSILARKDF